MKTSLENVIFSVEAAGVTAPQKQQGFSEMAMQAAQEVTMSAGLSDARRKDMLAAIVQYDNSGLPAVDRNSLISVVQNIAKLAHRGVGTNGVNYPAWSEAQTIDYMNETHATQAEAPQNYRNFEQQMVRELAHVKADIVKQYNRVWLLV